jgi:uncharacterized protein (TIGR02147 family)
MTPYRTLIQNHLSRRLAANPRYSLRAFARDLGLSPAYLSQILSGKRGLAVRKARAVLEKVGLTPEERVLCLLEIEREHLRSDKRKAALQQKINIVLQQSKAITLQGDSFMRMSEWYSMAILQLLRLKSSPRASRGGWVKWAAAQLGEPAEKIKRSLLEMTRLGLLKEHPRGWAVVHDTLWTTNGIPNPSIRHFHHQMINKAKAAVEEQSIDERFLQSMQLPVRSGDLDDFKADILKFRNQMMRKYGRTETLDGDAVYAMTMQLFRLTRPLTKGRGRPLE